MRKQPKTTALMAIVANFEHFANIGLASGVIIILTQDLHGKGHVVFSDRYYTSPRLVEYLGKVDMDVCGTVQKKRKTTPKILSEKMERKQPGFLEYCQCSKTVMAAYIYFLSNAPPDEDSCTAQRMDQKRNGKISQQHRQSLNTTLIWVE